MSACAFRWFGGACVRAGVHFGPHVIERQAVQISDRDLAAVSNKLITLEGEFVHVDDDRF